MPEMVFLTVVIVSWRNAKTPQLELRGFLYFWLRGLATTDTDIRLK